MEIISGLTYPNGRTICIFSSDTFRGEDFEESYEIYKDIVTFKEATENTFDLTFVSFCGSQKERFNEMKWYYGDGIYNFIIFNKDQKINQDLFLDNWTKFPPEETIAHRFSSKNQQNIWGKKITSYMMEIGCEIFITTDSDNAELRICCLSDHIEHALSVLGLKGIDIKHSK